MVFSIFSLHCKCNYTIVEVNDCKNACSRALCMNAVVADMK